MSQDWEQNLSEALFNNDEDMMREAKMEVFARRTFEMYLRTIKNLGEYSRDQIGEQL